jgi:hypothetical protein
MMILTTAELEASALRAGLTDVHLLEAGDQLAGPAQVTHQNVSGGFVVPINCSSVASTRHWL